ncbi:MAG: hypothetical protein RIQ52_379 [Pseudomonadota bacterium]|jgi:two-component system chemotaxis sensor kinase CheA
MTNPAVDSALTDKNSTLLRIDAAKIGVLMDLVGELSLSVSETVRSPDIAGMSLPEFEKSAHRLQLVVREIQDAASSLRLVEIGEVFRRMRRTVRELERETGKAIELELIGEETEIDKLIVDRLYEPLLHVLRNSVDHGLETREERTRIGKPETGRVVLKAAQSGSEIQITVSDDGRGLNREKILRKAREKGLVGAQENPDDESLWPVIFHPGFSTAEAVSNLSGRGVGMDVLNSTMQALRGRITLETREGHGTDVMLSIPMTLVFLDSMIVRVGQRIYAAPIDVVNEVLRPDSRQEYQISAQSGAEILKIRNNIVPVCRLQQFYNEPCEHPPISQQIVIVFNTRQGLLGLAVDELLDQQQVVMKPLQGRLESIRAALGYALLGTGEVAIVLDCETLALGYRHAAT